MHFSEESPADVVLTKADVDQPVYVQGFVSGVTGNLDVSAITNVAEGEPVPTFHYTETAGRGYLMVDLDGNGGSGVHQLLAVIENGNRYSLGNIIGDEVAELQQEVEVVARTFEDAADPVAQEPAPEPAATSAPTAEKKSADPQFSIGEGSTITGTSANDVFKVNEENVTISETEWGGSNDLVVATASHTLSENVEHLSLKGDGDINGTGNDGDNKISGNAGNNIIDGGDGFDKIYRRRW